MLGAMVCPLCNSEPLDTAPEQAMQACTTCAKRIGIVPMPPVTRPQRRCAKCNGGKFVRAIPREHGYAFKDGMDQQISRPMTMTNRPVVQSKYRWTEVANPPRDTLPVDLDLGWGMLEVYACFGCGAVEWYCNGVQQIPIHPHLMTEMIDLDGESPYR
jgi:hypothetical protein